MTWHELLDQAIRDFGDPPGAQLEQKLVDAYAEHPAAVQVTLRKVAEQHKKGTVRQPWGLVQAELAKQISVRANIPATAERAVAEARAEQWMRAAGLHFDRWPEVEDDLFGDRGRLHPWHTDDALKQRMERLWNEVRPAGEALEHDQLERADRWKQQRTPAPTKEPVAA